MIIITSVYQKCMRTMVMLFPMQWIEKKSLTFSNAWLSHKAGSIFVLTGPLLNEEIFAQFLVRN